MTWEIGTIQHVIAIGSLPTAAAFKGALVWGLCISLAVKLPLAACQQPEPLSGTPPNNIALEPFRSSQSLRHGRRSPFRTLQRHHHCYHRVVQIFNVSGSTPLSSPSGFVHASRGARAQGELPVYWKFPRIRGRRHVAHHVGQHGRREFV